MRVRSLVSWQPRQGSRGWAALLSLGWNSLRRRVLERNRIAPTSIHDALLATLSVATAFVLRLGWDTFHSGYASIILAATALFVVVALPTFHAFRLHRGAWRYASFNDLTTIVKAVTLAVLIFVLLAFVTGQSRSIPRSVPIIQWGILILALGGSRMTYRWARDRLGGRANGRNGVRPIPVLLLGAGPEAQLFLRAIEAGQAGMYRVVGILDVGRELIGRSINGVPVLGSVGELTTVIARLTQSGERPQRLIMAGPAEDIESKRELFEQAHRLGLTMGRLPRLTEFKKATDDDTIEVQPIALEDLLGRPQVALDHAAISQLVAGRRVLITGAGGSIGSELSRQIAALEPDALILADQCEFNLYAIDLELRESAVPTRLVPALCDVRDRARVERLFGEHRPEIVFHAAALKHVPLVEANPCESVLTNALGTRHVADAACAHHALAMVLISTDKAVKPSSFMGATKRLAEHYCQALDLATGNGDGTRFLTVRFGNVLGSSGSVVPLFQRQLMRGGPLTVTHPEISRYFMTLREAVELILQASAHGLASPDERGRILVLDMGEPIRIVDIARQMIRLAGLEPDRDVRIEFTGLRPGDKLAEELFDAGERPVRTEAQGVLAATPKPIDPAVLRTTLDQLVDAARRQDAARAQRLLSTVVTGFRPAIRAA